MSNNEMPDEVELFRNSNGGLELGPAPDNCDWLVNVKYIRATPQPIDVEKLKREVYAQEFVRHCECDSDLISCAIDHLAAHYNITKKGE